jgi:hypothetical protein
MHDFSRDIRKSSSRWPAPSFAPAGRRHFALKPTGYSLYTLHSPEQWVQFEVPKPTAVW